MAADSAANSASGATSAPVGGEIGRGINGVGRMDWRN